MARDPFQLESCVQDSFTLNAWVPDDMCQVMDDAAEGDYRDDKDSIGAAASAALKAICMQASPCYQSLIQRMDAAALKHMFLQKAMRNTCLDAALLKAHPAVLKHELIQKAQEHHGNQLMVHNHAVVKSVPSKAPPTDLWKRFLEWVLSCIVVIADQFRTRAADQMMQELVDAENKPHAKKKSKKKKKKKGAKASDNTQQQEAKLAKKSCWSNKAKQSG
ncbi:TPA: hypothetical protein ACH3X2_003988 [Trebouxia sp. C0005]